MADYIKRADAIKIINSGISTDTDADKRYVNGLFMAIPPADVALVRHGHWIFNQEDMTLHCSRCDEVFRFEETEQDECLDFMEYAKYCLACGAVMDEEADA